MATKTIFTHLLAAMFGMALVLVWPRGHKDSAAQEGGQPAPGPRVHERHELHPKKSTLKERRLERFTEESERELTMQDLSTWIESMSGEAKTRGQALVIAGILTDNPDLVRQGIEADPNNPHLLFIGANFSNFSKEERKELSKRLLEADPDNALAAYIAANQSMAAGDQDEAMTILASAEGRSLMNDYSNNTHLLMQDALLASGLSPDSATYRSTYNISANHLSDILNLAKSVKAKQESMTPEKKSETNRLLASMGYRLSNESRPTNFLDHLVGTRLELSTLDGLPDDAPSHYDGLTVGQARDAIRKEQEQIRETIHKFGDLSDMLFKDPDLMMRYLGHSRLAGEAEAVKWLSRTVAAQK